MSNVSKKDFNTLLEEAKWGKLSSEEIDYVAKAINEHQNDTRKLYTLIHILGRAKALKYKNLVESFLNYPDDPLVSQIALESLCSYWELTKDYIDELTAFLKGVDWDDFDDVRLHAISISGEYLRSSFNADLARALLALFDNPSFLTRQPENNELIQCAAYRAIARVSGRDYNQIPSIDKIGEQLTNHTLDLKPILEIKKRDLHSS